MKKKLYVTRKNFRICESNFFAKLFEQLEFIYFIKTNSIQSTFRKRVDDSFSEFSSAKVNDSYLQYLISILQGSISLFSQLLLLTVGAQCVYNGKITIGLLITFSTYFSQVQSGILYFLNLGSSYQNTRVSSQRIYDILSKVKNPLDIKCFRLLFPSAARSCPLHFLMKSVFYMRIYHFPFNPVKSMVWLERTGPEKQPLSTFYLVCTMMLSPQRDFFQRYRYTRH